MKRSGIRRGPGAKAKREQPAVDMFRAVIRERALGWCEARTPDCQDGMHAGSDCHHLFISDRDKGVHDPARGLLLCPPAHRWVHANPAEARLRGLLLREGDEL